MHSQTVMESVDRVLCVAFLVASVIPMIVMPYRIIQAFVDRTKKERQRGENVYGPVFAWLVYCIVVIGVVVSLHMLGVLDSGRALDVGFVCACLLGCLLLCCYIVAATYGMIAKWRSRR